MWSVRERRSVGVVPRTRPFRRSQACICLAGLALVLVLAAAPAAGALAVPATATSRSAEILELGASGPAVRAVQRALARVTFLPRSGVDGRFGWQTWHAAVAFQGWNALARDGIVGLRTRAALARSRRPTPWSRRQGYEVHVAEQVLLMVRGGRVRRAVHVSTGAGGATPLGHFRVLRRERMSWSATFHVWMPFAQYFWRGYAMHAHPSVPAYAASHGCIRVPNQEAETVWSFGRLWMRLWTTGSAGGQDGRDAARRAAGCR